jgi:hypothetical protein
MNKVRTAVVLAAGALAALGLAGTALAADGGFSASASPSVSPSSPYATSGVAVSVEAAKAIAIRAAGGGSVESVERETEHGVLVWDVDVIVGGVEHDIDVDSATGAVLRHRVKGGADVRVSATPRSSTSPRVSVSADDHGGRGRGSDDAAGDDRGGNRTRHAEPGDDKGGNRSRHAEPGDDKGGNRARGSEKGDDNGGKRRGGDDKGGDDKGGKRGGGHGSDD